MNRFLFSLFLLLALPVMAVDRITATVTFTNDAPTTNGMTFVVNGATRTWTNSVFIPSSQILTNETAAGSKTNLFKQIALNPYTSIILVDQGATNFNLIGASGSPLIISLAGLYAEISYSTQTVTTLTAVRVPVTGEPSAAVQTNIASALVSAISLNQNTNEILQASKAAMQLVGLTNAQTITGAKFVTGATILSNSSQQILGGVLTNNAVTSSNLTIYSNGSEVAGLRIEDNTGAMLHLFAEDEALKTTGNMIVLGQMYANTNLNIFEVTSGDINVLRAESDSIVLSQAGVSVAFRAPILTSDLLSSSNIISTNLITASKLTATNGAYLSSTNHIPAGGDLAFGRYANTSLASGNNAAVLLGTNVFMQVSGPGAAFAINGLDGSPNRDGKLAIIVNLTGFDMTIAHESGVDPTAGNRIISMTGGDRATTGNGAALLIYSGNSSRWLLLHLDP